ncbi:MAG: tetratricopeptide repeat protein [Phycisphaerales bacterium]|nr:tetratricopeptide repeat protein [Phycisphaerales bacterium]
MVPQNGVVDGGGTPPKDTAADSPPVSAPPWRRWIASAWTPAIVGALCYVLTIGSPFIRDDVPMIAKNTRLTEGGLRAIWLTDWWGAYIAAGQAEVPSERDRLYRPLTLTSFAIQARLHGLAPAGFRAANVILHAGACALVFLLARRLLSDDMIAALAGLLFAVHPVHAEAICEVVGRAEIIATLCLLAGLLTLLPRDAVPGWGRVSIAAAAFLLALFAKETAISYLPVAAILLLNEYRIARPAGSAARSLILRAALLIVPLLVYFPMRYVATEGRLFSSSPISTTMNPVAEAQGVAKLKTALSVAGHYARLMLTPLRLSTDYGYAVIDPAQGVDGIAILGAAALLLLAAMSVRWLLLLLNPRAARAESWRPGLFSVLLLVSYALISNFVLQIGVAVGERLFYWPSVWAVLLITTIVVGWVRAAQASAGGRLGGAARVVAALAALALPALAARTVLRTLDWRDPEHLWAADLAAYPKSVTTALNVGKQNLRRAQQLRGGPERDALLRRASEALTAALALRPNHAELLRQVGLVAYAEGDLRRAAQYFELALQYNPNDLMSRAGLDELRGGSSASNRLNELMQRVQADPSDISSRLELAGSLLRGGRVQEAIGHYEAAVRSAPENLDALRGLGQALLVAGRRPEAREPLLKVVERDPNDWQSHTNLFAAMERTDPAAALVHAEKAAALRPGDLTVMLNLAEAYGLNRRYPDGLRIFRGLLEVLPPGDANRPLIESRIRFFESAR